jgi:threonine/homoserine/homoserine lactone efflux protein
MAIITVDPVPTDAPGPIWVFIIAAILITWLGIKAWRRKARERRLRYQQEDKFKA